MDQIVICQHFIKRQEIVVSDLSIFERRIILYMCNNVVHFYTQFPEILYHLHPFSSFIEHFT